MNNVTSAMVLGVLLGVVIRQAYGEHLPSWLVTTGIVVVVCLHIALVYACIQLFLIHREIDPERCIERHRARMKRASSVKRTP